MIDVVLVVCVLVLLDLYVLPLSVLFLLALPYPQGPRYIETGRNPYMQQQYGNGGYGGGVFGGYGGGVGPYSSVGYGSTPYGYGGQSGAYGATHGFGGYQQPAYGTQPQVGLVRLYCNLPGMNLPC